MTLQSAEAAPLLRSWAGDGHPREPQIQLPRLGLGLAPKGLGRCRRQSRRAQGRLPSPLQDVATPRRATWERRMKCRDGTAVDINTRR